MDTRAVVAAFNGIGQKLYDQISKVEGRTNIVLSPISIGTALAMALAGARGETEREMRDVLGLDGDTTTMEAASGALLATLDSYNQGVMPSASRAEPEAGRGAVADDELATAARRRFDEHRITYIALANALLLTDDRGGAVLPAYKDRVARGFAAEVMAGASLETVNAWASAKTMGRVPQLLTKVDPNAVASLVNAMVFVASWNDPFDATKTKLAAFELDGGHSVEVATMHQSALFLLARGHGWRALRLGCRPPHLALVVGLPDVGHALETIDCRAIEALAVGNKGWTKQNVFLALPRFKLKASSALADPLRKLGMILAFDKDRADFGDLAAEVHISQVQHGATIEVHETGIAAAAAAVVEISARSTPQPFTIDRPFLFVLSDSRTGLVLMRGRVVDPRA